jgi:hypothetical protein
MRKTTQKTIIDRVIEQTSKRLAKAKQKCNVIIEEFTAPAPTQWEGEALDAFLCRRGIWLADRSDSGKFSVKALEKAYEDLSRFQEEEAELAHLSFLLGRIRK